MRAIYAQRECFLIPLDFPPPRWRECSRREYSRSCRRHAIRLSPSSVRERIIRPTIVILPRSYRYATATPRDFFFSFYPDASGRPRRPAQLFFFFSSSIPPAQFRPSTPSKRYCRLCLIFIFIRHYFSLPSPLFSLRSIAMLLIYFHYFAQLSLRERHCH